MAARHQKITIKISKNYNPSARLALAQEIIDAIIERTRKENVDKDGNAFPKYTKSYINSPEFKAAGKSKRRVDLSLSGDMLAELKLLNHVPGELTIGFEKGSQENAKADGNIRGTYGKERGNSSKARNFLGISRQDLAAIRDKFPLDDMAQLRARIKELDIMGKKAKEITGALKVAELEDSE
jgi:hypothetical protein